eukprot:690916-Ditylum_brightwellii.AAC.1
MSPIQFRTTPLMTCWMPHQSTPNLIKSGPSVVKPGWMLHPNTVQGEVSCARYINHDKNKTVV